MKKNTFLCLATLVLCLCGCSKDNDGEFEEPGKMNDEEFVEPANEEPEFADGLGQNPRSASSTQTTLNGVSVTLDGLGFVKWISFGTSGPESGIDMFSKYLELNPNEFYCYRQDKEAGQLSLECYQQKYKGIIVYEGHYGARFKNGRITDANGQYVKIDNLDVTPSFDKQKAMEIFAKYLNVSIDEIYGDHGVMPWFEKEFLFVKEYPVSKGSSEWAPRLVYGFYGGESACFIDAHTGRILETWSSFID